MNITKLHVYGLDESVAASKYPMSVDVSEVNDVVTDRVNSLASTPPGTGHNNFLIGIIVQFDLEMSNKAWVEAERYHWFDIVSSQSTMHKAAKMSIKKQVNHFVSDAIAEECERLQNIYNECPSDYNFLKLVYNLPAGFELTARITTNYSQLKTIYGQRKNHKLPDWQMICRMIKGLPHSEWITGEKVDAK